MNVCWTQIYGFVHTHIGKKVSCIWQGLELNFKFETFAVTYYFFKQEKCISVADV